MAKDTTRGVDRLYAKSTPAPKQVEPHNPYTYDPTTKRYVHDSGHSFPANQFSSFKLVTRAPAPATPPSVADRLYSKTK